MEVQMTNPQVASSDEIDLRELFSAIWQGKWLIIAVTSIFTIASVFIALSLPDVYTSEVTLAPAEDNSLKVPGQLGGLAALAGVNLGGMAGGDKSGLALEILKSRDFITRFIEKNDLYIPIMAVKGWDRQQNKLLIDPDIYSESAQSWVRDVKPPFQPKPSSLETVEEFRKLFSVNKDKVSGMVTISIEHYSPFLAKDWVEKIVQAINEEMRSRELTEAERSINYLNSKIAQTNIADVRSMLYSLIEEQTKTVMLANVRPEYVFKTVDPAVVAEKKVKPNRVLIVVFTVLLSSMFMSFIVVFRYLNRRSN
jgi:uncharacterized protein involved in exopolysaccharide biosynthesis